MRPWKTIRMWSKAATAPERGKNKSKIYFHLCSKCKWMALNAAFMYMYSTQYVCMIDMCDCRKVVSERSSHILFAFKCENCILSTILSNEYLSLYFPFQIMAKSRDWDELLYVWSEWRRKSGENIKDMYEQLMDLTNEAANYNSTYTRHTMAQLK